MSVENSSVDNRTPEEEHRYHHYTGNSIPWYVRLIWVLFWVFAIYYAVTYFLPTMQEEMVTPP
jgi:hypothetical protein